MAVLKYRNGSTWEDLIFQDENFIDNSISENKINHNRIYQNNWLTVSGCSGGWFFEHDEERNTFCLTGYTYASAAKSNPSSSSFVTYTTVGGSGTFSGFYLDNNTATQKFPSCDYDVIIPNCCLILTNGTTYLSKENLNSCHIIITAAGRILAAVGNQSGWSNGTSAMCVCNGTGIRRRDQCRIA